MPKRSRDVVRMEETKRQKKRNNSTKPTAMPKKSNPNRPEGALKRRAQVKRLASKSKTGRAPRIPDTTVRENRSKEEWELDTHADVGIQVHGSEIDFHVDKLMRRQTGQYDLIMRNEIRHKRQNYKNLFVGARLKRHNSSYFRRPIPYGHGQLEEVEYEKRKKGKGAICDDTSGPGIFDAARSKQSLEFSDLFNRRLNYGSRMPSKPEDGNELVNSALASGSPRSMYKRARTHLGRNCYHNHFEFNPYIINGDRYESSSDKAPPTSAFFHLKCSGLHPYYYLN